MDTVFRTKVEKVESEQQPIKSGDGSSTAVIDSVEVPYTDYEATNRKPFTVDYFKIGDYWDDPEGGYESEIRTIEEYFKGKIEKGDISNTINSVKNELKEMEKLHNLKNEDRMTIKIGTISAYIKFLEETGSIKKNQRKYGNY